MSLRVRGFELVGITLIGPPPLGRVDLEFRGGVTALYGKNGAGKSSVLAAAAAALSGRKTPGAWAALHFKLDLSDPELLETVSMACELVDALWPALMRLRRFVDDQQRADIEELVGNPEDDEWYPPDASHLPSLIRLFLVASLAQGNNAFEKWYELVGQVANNPCFSLHPDGVLPASMFEAPAAALHEDPAARPDEDATRSWRVSAQGGAGS